MDFGAIGDMMLERLGAPALQGLQSAKSSTVITQSTDPNGGGLFRTGIVTRAMAGSYDCIVSIGGNSEIACLPLIPQGDPTIGVSAAYVPVEGSTVMVYTSSPSTKFGIIMGVIPKHANVAPEKDAVQGGEIRPCWQQESGAGFGTEKAYSVPLTNKEDMLGVRACAARPVDLLPGSHVLRNEQGVGVGINRFAAGLLASPRAQIRVSQLDDQVRINSGHFIHFNAGGVDQVFNDAGHVSGEFSFTPHQCEHSGFNDYGMAANKEGGIKNFFLKALDNRWNAVKSRLAPKKRIQVFMGHLGGLFSLFIAKPDPNQNPETEDAASIDQGLMHVNVDGGGRLMVRTASGFSFQRRDRIQVPKRVRQPWDPEGVRLEDNPEVSSKSWFQFNSSYPYARSLQLRDAMAWRVRQAYERIFELSAQNKAKTAGKDFYLPNETDTKVPDDEYDTVTNDSGQFKDFKDRQSCINFEDDGSIILRDAWGSEIALRGGNILLSCAGQVEVKSGGSTVVMAGHDVIMKGRKSVDITATDNDVRLKAERNLLAVANVGGVLVESKSEGAGTWAGEGETQQGGGVTIKAQSAVAVLSTNLTLNGKNSVSIDTMDEMGTPDNGSLMISAGNITAAVTRQCNIAAGDGDSALTISKGSANLIAPEVALIGGNSAAVIKGSTAMIPVQWADIGSNPYDESKAKLLESFNQLIAPDWLAPLTPLVREQVTFTFRSKTEYGTFKGTEIYKAPAFHVYQAPWAYLKSKSMPLIEGTIAKWVEKRIEGGLPWPGDVGSAYVVLVDEVNIKDKDTGVSENMVDVKDEGGVLTTKDFETEYEVLET